VRYRTCSTATMRNSLTVTLVFINIPIMAVGSLIGMGVQEKPLGSSQSGKPTTDTIIARGCLVRADRSAHRPGTTGSSAPGLENAEPTAFLLKWATTSQDPGGLEAKGSQREFGVRGDNAKLTQQLGHEVEVQGRLVSARSPLSGSASSSPVQGTKASTSTQEKPDGVLNTGGYDVEAATVRTLHEDCRR
jgi:hypothetical protein